MTNTTVQYHFPAYQQQQKEFWDAYQQQAEASNVTNARKLRVDCCLCSTAMPIQFALIIIGICAAAGALSGVVAGGCVIALSIPLLLISLKMGRKNGLGKDRTWEFLLGVITSLACCTLAVLAILRVLPPTIVGYVAIAAPPICMIASCVSFCCMGSYRELRRNH